MTYAYSATFRAKPGNSDKVVAILTRPSSGTAEAGCLLYEVGIGDDADVIHVIELWESAQAHTAALQMDSVVAAIAEALPMLTPDVSGFGFEVSGSPLRHGS